MAHQRKGKCVAAVAAMQPAWKALAKRHLSATCHQPAWSRSGQRMDCYDKNSFLRLIDGRKSHFWHLTSACLPCFQNAFGPWGGAELGRAALAQFPFPAPSPHFLLLAANASPVSPCRTSCPHTPGPPPPHTPGAPHVTRHASATAWAGPLAGAGFQPGIAR